VVETRIPREPLPSLSALATSRPQLAREVEMVASGVPRRAPHAAVHLTKWNNEGVPRKSGKKSAVICHTPRQKLVTCSKSVLVWVVAGGRNFT